MDPEVVYDPDTDREFLGTARHEELKEWLRANGIVTADVPVDEEITIELLTFGGDRAIHHTAYLRNADGKKYLDEATGDAAQEARIVPLTTDPPPHWRTRKEND
ncbi:hypothetical protein FHS35_009104 [Streptomyces umbrinus]|uniref:hypothetical protein n=1 Tax=Streptomyces umbrinus TaxID=67370 RepID=UPI00167C4B96|nr:hypothetical protein [Streptomyces umbrinus]MCR3732186.1 hypothetical protein [Streptomyces umbrinus]GHH68439.1 hypothetical protein GCM10018775_93000 [Streptomyces umbrinus]